MAAVTSGLLAVAGIASAGVRPHRHRAAAPPPVTTVSCTLVVPARPLSARGLATPYRLIGSGGKRCAERAFVQGTIVDPVSGRLAVYDPLVIDDGTRPAVAPVVPKLPAHATVAVWFGFNGDDLTLRGGRGGSCVNGLGRSVFGQYAYCNAPAFFTVADRAIRSGRLGVPAIGRGRDGKPCPTTRDFTVVDQDQSDNVTTAYLAVSDGTTAQDTAANRARLGRRAQVETNGSDNLLIDAFVDTALGCTPFTAPDLADGGRRTTALALDELQAEHQSAPVALVPTNDPMTLLSGHASLAKTDLYRAGVDQGRFDPRTESPRRYCRDMVALQPARLRLDKRFTVGAPSPEPGASANLFAFLAQRLQGSFDQLGCGALLGRANPVTPIGTTDARFS